MSNTETDSNGTKRWFNSQGKFHREDGPAIEWVDGTKAWWINGKLHREDGPLDQLPLYLGLGFNEFIGKRLKTNE